MNTKTLNVVMMATNRSNIYLHNNKIYNSKTSMHIPDGNQIPQHLYFTSDNEIKENENDYYVNGKYLYLANKNYKKAENDRKIEATTDTKLHAKFGNDGEIYGMMKGGIPSISQLFVESYIKAYNEGNPILTVDVVVDCDHTQMPIKVIDVIQTNSSNEVIIVEPINDDGAILLLEEIFNKLGNTNDFMQNDLLGLKISTLLNDVNDKPKLYTKEEVQILLMQAWINGEANPNKHFSFRETWIENNL